MLTIVDLNRNEELSTADMGKVTGGFVSWEHDEDGPSEEITFEYGSLVLVYGVQN
jgi:hypothetical protein